LETHLHYTQTEELFQQCLTNFDIEIDRSKLNSLPLFTLINEIFRIYSFSVNNPFLLRLLDEAENFITRRSVNVSNFLTWWEEKGKTTTLSTPQGFDAVTVSTIHKVKGLEYPIVIFPFSRYHYWLTNDNMLLHDTEHVSGLEYDWVTLTKDKTPRRYQYKYEEESRKTYTDKLNLLYVAHTRASRELHIITEKEEARGGNYSKFLAGFVERMGEKEKGEKEKRKKEEMEVMPRKLDDKNRSQLSTPLSHIPILPTPFTSSPFSSPVQYGIFIHDFLASLPSFPQNDEEIRRVVQNVEETYRENLVAIFHKILNDKEIAPYFAPHMKVLNETSILFPDGNLVRPDRVVFLEDKVVVIDYKTGDPHVSHKEQIDQYCEAIRKMGNKNVHGHILYI
jgi:ATP-dependent exoDNAse (exonuclease V) beta subunit